MAPPHRRSCLLKQKLDAVDKAHLWEYCLPRIAATEDELAAVEARIGEALDPIYREFLSYAGGWPAFFHDADLFGPEDFLGGAHFHHATEMLGFVDERVLSSAGFRRDELIPIAASREDLDLFVITRRTTSTPGIVIWLADSEIDRFRNFDEFFAAMVDYHRLDIERAAKR